MKYLITDGYIVNVSNDPETQFHPDIASQFVSKPAGMPAQATIGWRLIGSTWVAPPAPPEPEPVLTKPLSLTFVQFVGLAMQAGGMTPTNYATARSNPALIVFFDLLLNAQGIEKNDPFMAIGGDAFVSEGMLTQGGWDAMLANWPEA